MDVVGMRSVVDLVNHSSKGMLETSTKGCSRSSLLNGLSGVLNIVLTIFQWILVSSKYFTVWSKAHCSSARRWSSLERWGSYSVIYAKRSWKSVSYAAVLYIKVEIYERNVSTAEEPSCMLKLLNHIILNERAEQEMDVTFQLPPKLGEILADQSLWRNVNMAVDTFESIYLRVRFLESHTVVWKMCILRSFSPARMFCRMIIFAVDKQRMDKSLLRSWDWIYSPVHALEFCCEHFYRTMQLNVSTSYRSISSC